MTKNVPHDTPVTAILIDILVHVEHAQPMAQPRKTAHYFHPEFRRGPRFIPCSKLIALQRKSETHRVPMRVARSITCIRKKLKYTQTNIWWGTTQMERRVIAQPPLSLRCQKSLAGYFVLCSNTSRKRELFIALMNE